MDKETQAVTIWRVVNFLRCQPNWRDLEKHAHALDLVAIQLAEEAGTSFDVLAQKYDLYH